MTAGPVAPIRLIGNRVANDENPLELFTGLGYTSTFVNMIRGMALQWASGSDDAGPEGDLIRAVVDDQAAAAAAALHAGASCDARDRQGWAALSLAAALGHVDMCRVLARAGASLCPIRDNQPKPVLLEALDHAQEAAAHALLDLGADPNTANGFGHTALMTAARHGLTTSVAALLKAGACPSAANAVGTTALMEAAMCGAADLCAALLAAGADVNAVDQNGADALMRSVDQRKVEATLIGVLLDAGADATRVATDGATALLVAAGWGHSGCVRRLLAAGADPNAGRMPDGQTALMRAAQGDARGDCVRALLKAGADPLQRDHNGRTADELVPAPHIFVRGLLTAERERVELRMALAAPHSEQAASAHTRAQAGRRM